LPFRPIIPLYPKRRLSLSKKAGSWSKAGGHSQTAQGQNSKVAKTGQSKVQDYENLSKNELKIVQLLEMKT